MDSDTTSELSPFYGTNVPGGKKHGRKGDTDYVAEQGMASLVTDRRTSDQDMAQGYTGMERTSNRLASDISDKLDGTAPSECSWHFGYTSEKVASHGKVRYSRGGKPAPRQKRTEKSGHPLVNFKLRRLQANERERKRMQSLKEAFDLLRDHLPGWANEKHMSKYDVLLLARSYIVALQSVLDQK
ncbi:hypothetical protein RvY_13969-1 [Ramazzottius varieornatus]|uniref:BHLH domain-containing protein n=1 Tax=Ramazzottius varieornatus TaxID=947166 RepID=A0A1D1VPR8_RAMVA|nr:hypothetical protein RvY_13969-1 [Ramazzottius varieornatus]